MAVGEMEEISAKEEGDIMEGTMEMDIEIEEIQGRCMNSALFSHICYMIYI